MEAILLVHRQQIERFGGASGIRDKALLMSALGATEHTWHYGGDLYQTAANYCYSLASNHPFIDGNKRVAAASMLIFLAMNGVRPPLTSEQLYQWTMSIVTGGLSRDDLASLLRGVSG
ncbi:MAG: type II toxin-antitoxin system death-on-curing family toxin [Chromatiaceae bacterium]|nr:type II toxin-antitoxin system death-on-curing family toxin [Chromatiaceae bacterium]MCF8015747.1 type II toxin-antitoxin system death-on-curing family toxin [Chromatiaceae bacterium]